MSATLRTFLRCTAIAILLANPSLNAQTREAPLQRLPGNPAPNGSRVVDRGPVPDTMALDHILLMLRRSATREQALDAFMRRQYDPHSGDFHHWLTPEQFGEQFGPSPADVAAVTQWLVQQGFTVNHVPAGGLFVDFSGTAGKVARAFHTEIHHYQLDGEDHYANASDPAIPASLASTVSGFRALNDFHPHPQVRHLGTAHYDRSTGTWSRVTEPRPRLTNPPGSTIPLYIAGPQDFATIYSIDQVWKQHANGGDLSPLLVGTGQTIGVVGEADPQSADVQNFRDQFGLTALGPHGSVQIEHPPASVCAAPNPATNEPESYLDVEWAGATAPDATIDFVACGRQGTTTGADLAAAYIVADPAHVQKISVLSTSYGDCETQPLSEANQFYVSLWQQAAAEGITVVVAAGDTGSDNCRGVYTYAQDGLTVVNVASTPYNVAVGGTDFSDVFSGTAATYWAPTNGPNSLSARSYIPEMVWNDTCASPLVLEKFGSTFNSASGPNGFCTYAAKQPINPNSGLPPYFFAFAGGGGLSTVSARPSWQAGVPGLPAQAGRAVPDISMFAAVGDTWSQTLIVCDSGLVNLPPGTGCDFTNANDVYAGYGGGTSFVAPAFAGIMALLDQKTGGRQGQINNVLYPMASAQFVNNSDPSQPSLATCAAYLGPQVASGCYFHDISATPNPAAGGSPAFFTGTTAIPCTGTATAVGTFTDASSDPASNSRDCYNYGITVTQNGASLTSTPNYYGVLSTADNAASPAFAATPGYDLATGLGSPNVFALINAPQWPTLAITTISLPPGYPGIAYSQTLTATGRVTPYTWSLTSGSLPAGLSLAPGGTIAGTPTALGNSIFTVQVADSENPPATVAATYSITVTTPLLPSATTLTASAVSAGTGSSVTLTANVSGTAGVPTGTVTFTNGSTAIGTATLANGAASLPTSFSNAGTFIIEASYSGDGTYSPSTSLPLTETIAAPGYVAVLNPTGLTIPFGNAGVATFTLTPQGGFTGPVTFSCGTLPLYFSCNFASSSVTFSSTGQSIDNKLTINAALLPLAATGNARGTTSMLAAITFWLPAGMGLLGSLRRGSQKKGKGHLRAFCLVGGCFVALAGISACGRGDHQAPVGTYKVPVVLQAQGQPNQSFTVTVTVN